MVYRMCVSGWSVERIVFGVAGLLVAGSTLLALFVHPLFIYFTIFVGFMLMFFSLTGYCPMAIFVAKITHKRSMCAAAGPEKHTH